jgi:CheY-like chemotaxis protein
MDGYEVARRIRADRRNDGVTLIAMTGWGQDEDRKRTRAEGFDHHLIKPPDIVALQTVLASIDGGGRRRARAIHA